jgi:hypothetical protein
VTGRCSEGVLKLAVWVSGLVSYDRAAEVLERVGHLPISDSSIWRAVQQWGQRMEAAAEHAPRVTERCTDLQEVVSERRMGGSMDGGMVHVRGEGWKELKVGAIFEVHPSEAVDVRSGEAVERGRAVEISYSAHLGGPVPFGEHLYAEACRRGWERAKETVILADGAAWIWNQASTHFYDSRQVVDWYHATEHLGHAATLLYESDMARARPWLERWKTALYQGHADRVAEELMRQATARPKIATELEKEAAYFRHNQHRMYYMQMREDGWPIGSGTVESGCKQYKQRLTGPGMRWSRAGAERILPIRTAIMSGHFDQLWTHAYNSPPN